jgi:hypothetical protein
MSLLSRLFGKRLSIGGAKPPEAATPDAPGGSLTITIDASQHIVQAVTVFRNNTAQVVRTFNDLTLKVRLPSTEKRHAGTDLYPTCSGR